MSVRIRANVNVMQFKRGQEVDLDEDEALELLSTGRFTFVSETIESPEPTAPVVDDVDLDEEIAAFNDGGTVQKAITQARSAALDDDELVDLDDEGE